MARCARCDACQSQWDFEPCNHCGYPHDEKRTPEQIEKDDADYLERTAVGED